MNTTIKTIALALGIGFAAQAQEISNLSEISTPDYYAKMTIQENSTKMRVLMANIKNQNVTFKLKDAKKNNLYSTVLRKNETQAHFYLNLKDLPEGIYTVELSDKKGSTSKQFRKSGELIVTRLTETLVAIN